MDGTEESVEIASIDGLDGVKGFSGNFDVNKDNATTEQGDTASDVAIVDGKKVAYVSTISTTKTTKAWLCSWLRPTRTAA